ncbi:MAG: carbon storage regulator [Planctomycetaceae bacterium]
MLVLNRKQFETIHIGDDVVIRIQAIKGSSVRVAIEAPPTVRIVRGELTVSMPQPQLTKAES